MRPAASLSVLLCLSAVQARAGVLGEEEARGNLIVEPVEAPEAVDRVFVGATVWTSAGDRLSSGYVVVQGGEITAVGEGAAPSIDGATVVDVKGKHLTPGLIDTHSHLGVYASPDASAHGDGNEMTAPTTPGVWAEHSVWPQDPGFEHAVAGGITTLQILPGSANLVGGRGVVMRPVPTRGARAMRFDGAPPTVKMACGENPKRVYGGKNRAPATRMGNLRGQREAFLAAEVYLRKWKDYEAKRDRYQAQQETPPKKKDRIEEPEPPARDLDKETLALILDGQALPQIHCYRADDMLAMLQVSKEFGFSVRSFHHATEAYKIADVLAAEGVAASVWPEWWGFKMEANDAIPANGAILAAAGGRTVIHSDSATTIQRLNQEAAKAWASGRRAGLDLSEEDALTWVTLNPAWALGIDELTGSLEVGKRADLVVWDGPPLSVYSSPEQVYIDGALVYEPDEDALPWSDYALGTEVAP